MKTYICDTCLKELGEKQVVVVSPTGTSIEVDVPGGGFFRIGKGDDCHFCSVDCLCEFIRVKASELGAA